MKKLFILIIVIILFSFIFGDVEIFSSNVGTNIIYDYSKEREISTITFFFDGGTANYARDKAGIERFLLEAIQKGSSKYSESDINVLMDKYGLRISFENNYDYSSISFTTFNNYFNNALDIAADMLSEPLFLNKNIEIIRRKMIDNIKSKEENPDKYVWLKMNDWFFREHQYISLPDGYIETVSNITRDDLKGHLDFLTKKNKVLISIVTGIPLQNEENIIKEKLSFMKTEKNWKKVIPSAFKDIERDTVMYAEKENLQTEYVACKFLLPSVTNDAFIPARIGLSILSKRIWETLRTKHGLTYATYMGASDKKVNYGVFYVSTDYPDSAISLFYQEMKKFKKEGVTQREIDDLRNIYETSFYMNNEKSDERSFTNGYNFMIYGDYDHNAKFMKRVGKIKPKEINNVLSEYLKNYQFLILR
ncbi:MAG: hypothetical protein COX48_04545 [bacterium (Candidatus Stahlbacteria) CG23_combo_of_CG06-09_8_20_14_all_34_7]|nr:MAG: hypothetical protein COX48_04545 [bacterium (Candidatus Stahlbacteria) CG23_combo_of_CG06-09_8_20_14_all_34_7]